MIKVAAIGECMIELAPSDAAAAARGEYTLRQGGDTFNTAVYMSRLGVVCEYVTALGDDPLSQGIVDHCRAENIGTDLIARVPGRMPGLYMIQRDAKGERSFLYWRDRAPAREVFNDPSPALVTGLLGMDWLYFSGITLSLYGVAGRERFAALLKEVRAKGVKIAFDGNYRPRGWPVTAEAHAAFAQFLPLVDIALPTLDDEQMLFRDSDADACATRLLAAGVGEVVVKQGPVGCLITTAVERVFVPSEPGVTPLDTTAAGDSFNAGYLAARLKGAGVEEAARAGHTLAARVICHPGAIIPREAMP
jgi:2-dehydro-3-deoxygluconokinase